MNKSKLLTALKDFLTKEGWDTWLTITFRNPVKSENAKKMFKRFLKHINTRNETFYRKFIFAWLFVEENKFRPGVHIHAIIKGIPKARLPLLEKRCFERFGESKALPIHEGVIPYVAEKYVTSTLQDWEPVRINSRLRKRPSLQ